MCSKLHNKDHEWKKGYIRSDKKPRNFTKGKKIAKLKLYYTWLISRHFPEEGSMKKGNVMVHNKDHEKVAENL